MTPIDCLREVREATAGELAAVTGTPLEEVYEALVNARADGVVTLFQLSVPHPDRPIFLWRYA